MGSSLPRRRTLSFNRTAVSAAWTRNGTLWGVQACILLAAGAAYFILVSLLLPRPGLVSAAVPQDLTNFQNEYPCDPNTTRIVRPRNVRDVQAAVQLHDRVKASGEGHSWNQPFFCVNGSSAQSAANIVLSTIRPLNITVNEDDEWVEVDAGVLTIDLIQYLGNYVTAKAPSGWTLPAFPWFVYQSIGGAVATNTHGSSLQHKSLSNQVLQVTMVLANGTLHTFSNETDPFLMRAARVGVGKLGIITRLRMQIVRDLPVRRTLRLMPTSAFLTLIKEAQQEWNLNKTLPAWLNETEFFWITQRSEFMMVSFTRGDVADPAVRSTVLSEYVPQNTTLYNSTMELLKYGNATEMADTRLLDDAGFTPSGLAANAKEVTDNLLNDVINRPLPPLVQQFAGSSPPPSFSLSPPNDTSAADNGTYRELAVDVASGVQRAAAHLRDDLTAKGSKWTLPAPKAPLIFYASPGMASAYTDISRAGVLLIARNATIEASTAYLYQPREAMDNIRSVLYDQYEVAMPVSTMADCFASLMDAVYDGDIDSLNATQKAQDKGFRTAPLIRFIGHEDGLLALAGDGPRAFINIEDYVFYNGGRKPNEKFRAVVAHFRSHPACGASGLNGTGARLHWGKAGWPDKGCFHGDKEYGENWCDFGCAVHALDPTNKFADSASDRWTWAGVDLDACCGPQGFLRGKAGCACKVQHARGAADCPPPPFYTNR